MGLFGFLRKKKRKFTKGDLLQLDPAKIDNGLLDELKGNQYLYPVLKLIKLVNSGDEAGFATALLHEKTKCNDCDHEFLIRDGLSQSYSNELIITCPKCNKTIFIFPLRT